MYICMCLYIKFNKDLLPKRLKVIKICQTAYFELKRISLTSRFLTEDATLTLVTSYILSRLDYCNCLLMGAPNSVIQPLQNVQNCCKTHLHGTSSSPLYTSPGKGCTGFPFQSALNTKLHACASLL